MLDCQWELLLGLGDKVGDSVGRAVGDIIGLPVVSSVGASVRDKVGGSVGVGKALCSHNDTIIFCVFYNTECFFLVTRTL